MWGGAVISIGTTPATPHAITTVLVNVTTQDRGAHPARDVRHDTTCRIRPHPNPHYKVFLTLSCQGRLDPIPPCPS